MDHARPRNAGGRTDSARCHKFKLESVSSNLQAPADFVGCNWSTGDQCSKLVQKDKFCAKKTFKPQVVVCDLF